MDGRHVYIKAPANAGFIYYSYKKWFSIILLAVVDADYSFSRWMLGAPGSENNATVFEKWDFMQVLHDNQVSLPACRSLHGGNSMKRYPLWLIGDGAFLLKWWMMKLFRRSRLAAAETILNYRLSMFISFFCNSSLCHTSYNCCRSCQDSENAFVL